MMISSWATPTAALGSDRAGLGGAGLLGAANIPRRTPNVSACASSADVNSFALLLLPVAFLASEIDNDLAAFFPAPDAHRSCRRPSRSSRRHGSRGDRTLIVGVGLSPVVEEWFFRGVIQQGLVAGLGAPAGVFVTALFFALIHGAGLSMQAWAALTAQALLFGLAFGYARHRTGSLLASILLHIGTNGMGVVAMAAPALIAIPGYNAPGVHTPLVVLVPRLSRWRSACGLSRETVPPIPVVPVLDESDYRFED